jgi:nitroreductase
MSISDAIAERKSVRAYRDEPVSSEVVDAIVEAGRWAPNHGDYHVSVIRDPQLKQQINDRTLAGMKASGIEFLEERAALPGYQPLYGAPVVVLLSGPAESPTTPFNCALVVENMLLQATEAGLGSCFNMSAGLALGGEENRALAEEAGIPKGYTFQCGLVFGHAAAENKFSPDPSERARRGTLSYMG